jgi:hypothetical protein
VHGNGLASACRGAGTKGLNPGNAALVRASLPLCASGCPYPAGERLRYNTFSMFEKWPFRFNWSRFSSLFSYFSFPGNTRGDTMFTGNYSPPYRNPVGRAISLHFLRSISVFLRARYAQIAELALARSNSVNFMGSAH